MSNDFPKNEVGSNFFNLFQGVWKCEFQFCWWVKAAWTFPGPGGRGARKVRTWAFELLCPVIGKKLNQPQLVEDICHLGGGFKYLSFFNPYLGRWSNLKNIFFRWVAQPLAKRVLPPALTLPKAEVSWHWQERLKETAFALIDPIEMGLNICGWFY